MYFFSFFIYAKKNIDNIIGNDLRLILENDRINNYINHKKKNIEINFMPIE